MGSPLKVASPKGKILVDRTQTTGRKLLFASDKDDNVDKGKGVVIDHNV